MSPPGAGQRPVLVMGGFGVAMAWRGPLGPTVACFDAWSRRTPRFARGLGHPGADVPGPVALAPGRESLRVAWCEGDGAWSAEVHPESGEISRPIHRVPGARRVALATGVLFAADERGVVAAALDADGPGARVLHERRSGLVMDAATLRDEPVVVFAYPGDPAWGVIALPRDGAPVVVRHALSAPCVGVRVRAVGSRAAVLLELEGGDARLAVLGPGAKVIERPHRIFAHGTGRVASPDVVWTDDRWTALAHRPDDHTLLGQPVGKGDAFSLPRCAGPFAACFFHNRFYILEVEPGEGEGTELRLWRSEPDGSSPQQRVLRVAVDDARVRRMARDVRQTLRGVADRIETAADYRTQAARPTVDPDGATLRLEDERGALSLSARPVEEGLALRVYSVRGERAAPEQAPSSLVRLARWIRERWSAEARHALERQEAWARALAEPLDADVEEVAVAGNTLVLGLLLRAVPEPEALERWLRRLREEPGTPQRR